MRRGDRRQLRRALAPSELTVPEPELSPHIRSAGHALKVDAVTAEVVEAIESAGIDVLLLKGPAIARWLYGKGERTYKDTDLLVPPDRVDDVLSILAGLGFTGLTTEIAGNRPRIASEWVRARDGAAVDVHWSLEGAKAAPEKVWRFLSESPDPMDVLGREVRVPARPALLMHIALHAAQHGGSVGQVMEDLDRSVETGSLEEWAAAAELAGSLDADAAFATGLSLSARGRSMAERLDLDAVTDTEAALTASSLPLDTLSVSLGFEWARSQPGVLPKLRYVLRKLFPPRDWMIDRYPKAASGGVGLVFSYLDRWVWIARRVPRGFVTWVRVRKGTSRG